MTTNKNRLGSASDDGSHTYVILVFEARVVECIKTNIIEIYKNWTEGAIYYFIVILR